MTTQHGRADDLTRLDDLFRRPSSEPAPTRAPIDPETRRRRRGIRAAVAAVVVLVLAGLAGGYVASALTAPVGAPVATTHRPEVTAPAAATLALPTDAQFAVSVSGADQYLGASAGTSLAASGGDSPAPIASISKLITAMVILAAKPLGASDAGPTITFSKADHALYDAYYVRGATIAPMPTGSRMSERDALKAILIVSASNYAEAVSTWAYGSQPAFLAATRRWLAAHGLTHTTMVDPTGLAARNRSSPSDLIALGKLALADPVIPGIVQQSTLNVATLPSQASTNDLLGTDGVDGIKTGTLEGYGSELLFSALVDVGKGAPLRVIGVELGGPDRAGVDYDVQNFIASLTAGFHPVKVSTAGRKVGTYTTPWGATATMRLEDSASLFTWSSTPVTSTMSTTALTTGRSGERVGSVTWRAGTATKTVPIVLDGRIRPPTSEWRLTHPKQVLHWSWWPF